MAVSVAVNTVDNNVNLWLLGLGILLLMSYLMIRSVIIFGARKIDKKILILLELHHIFTFAFCWS
jgi:hypothetical protein